MPFSVAIRYRLSPRWTTVVAPGLALEPPSRITVLEQAANASAMPAMTSRRTTMGRSEEHTSELQSLMRISYAVFCLKKKTTQLTTHHEQQLKHSILHKAQHRN